MRNFAKVFKSWLQSESTITLLLVQLVIKYNEQEVLNMLRVESFDKLFEQNQSSTQATWREIRDLTEMANLDVMPELGPLFPSHQFSRGQKAKNTPNVGKAYGNACYAVQGTNKKYWSNLGIPWDEQAVNRAFYVK